MYKRFVPTSRSAGRTWKQATRSFSDLYKGSAPDMQSDVETGNTARSRLVNQLSSRLPDRLVTGSIPKTPPAYVGMHGCLKLDNEEHGKSGKCVVRAK